MKKSLFALLLLGLPHLAFADIAYDVEYGVATAVDVCLASFDEPQSFETAATFEEGDVRIRLDDGSPVNLDELPSSEGACYSVPLTAAEMSADRAVVILIDQSTTKVWMDYAIYLDMKLPADILVGTTIATLATQTSFTLTAGSSDDNAYNGHRIIITDASTATQKAVGEVLDYVGSTRTVTLKFDPGVFTIAVGDLVTIQAK